MQNANRQSRVHIAAMVRKLLLLLVIVAVVWFGARALVHRGEVKATIVFDHAVGLHKGDPGRRSGIVTKFTRRDERDAVPGRSDREHRRDVVSDSMFAIGRHSVVVTNTFAVGSPVADGAVLRVRTDGVRSWLAKHAGSIQPLIAKVKHAADQKIDQLDEKHLEDRKSVV